MTIQHEAMWLYAEVEHSGCLLRSMLEQSPRAKMFRTPGALEDCVATLESHKKAYWTILRKLTAEEYEEHAKRVDSLSGSPSGQAKEVVSRFFAEEDIREE